MFLTGGGSGVKVWDMTAGTEFPVKEMWNHQKEITALCGNINGSRVHFARKSINHYENTTDI